MMRGRWGWDKEDIDDWTMMKEDSYVEGMRARWGRHQRDDEDNDDKPGMTRWEGWWRDVKDETMKWWSDDKGKTMMQESWQNDNQMKAIMTTTGYWQRQRWRDEEWQWDDKEMRRAKRTRWGQQSWHDNDVRRQLCWEDKDKMRKTLTRWWRWW